LLAERKAAVFPTEVYVEGNRSRVDWIKTFLINVHVQSRHTGELSLEEKIERLQRRLGGKPVPIDNRLAKIDHRQNLEKVETMKKKLEDARKGQEGEAPKVDLNDPELLKQFRDEQDKLARAKKAAEEKIRKEKEEALAK
jgi:hypothetical protein